MQSENKQIYMRVHRELEPAIEVFCAQNQLKPAAAVREILTEYLTQLARRYPDPDCVTRAELGFDPQAEAYFAPIGRSDTGRVLGKRRIITMSRELDRLLMYYAQRCGLRAPQFRTAVLATYFAQNGQLNVRQAPLPGGSEVSRETFLG